MPGTTPAKARWREQHPVLSLILRRSAIGLVTLFVLSILVFLATQVLPGNAAYVRLGQEATQQQISVMENQLGLNRGAVDQYWTWLSGLLTGHPGTSLANGLPVWGQIWPRLLNSATLVVASGVIGAVLAIGLGAFAALRKDSKFDHVTSVILLTAASLPEFVVAIGLIVVFATIVFRVLPSVSILPPGTWAWTQPELLILPVATLVIVIVPYMFRMMRAATVEALESDYVEMARMQGLREWRVIVFHVLPNTVPPVVQVIGLQFAYLVGGIVVVEAVFNYPGIGLGLVQAVNNRDIPMIQLIVVILAAVYVYMNIVTDVIALLASPRRRLAR